MLQQARRRAGLNQVEVAARAGTSQPVISAYERGHRDPSVSTLRRLVQATGGRLELSVRSGAGSDLPPPADDREHAQRLMDVLSLSDALPATRRGPLNAPVFASRSAAR